MGNPFKISANVVKSAAILLIYTYQLTLRPLMIGSCKFHPTCSEYAIGALQTHGLWHGARLAANRLLRCHPFSAGGIDPVPETDTEDGPMGRPHPRPGG